MSTFYSFLTCAKSLEILDYYPEIAVYRIKNASKAGRVGATKNMSKEKRDTLSRKTIWKHIKHKNENDLPLTIIVPAQINQLSVHDFLKGLIKRLPVEDQKREHYLNNLRSGNRILTSYLNGQSGHYTLYGFVLQNPSPNSKIIKRSVSGQSRTNQETKRLQNLSNIDSLSIIQKESFVLKHNNSLISNIIVKPKQFTVLSDLARHTFNTYNEYKKPDQVEQLIAQTQIPAGADLIKFIKSQFLADVKSHQYSKFKSKSCYGWTIEKIRHAVVS